VLIPRSNVEHLMLREDVVEAVRSGQFHVWPVATIAEGIEVLTGVPAGERRFDGRFAEGTVNDRVDRRLHAFGAAIRGMAGTNGARPQLVH
jgi:predicted ATP-dependent protease